MRKIHKLGEKVDFGNHKTICGQKGLLCISNNTGKLLLQGIPFGADFDVSRNDQEVTCTLCVRKIIGQPRRGVKKILSKHSVHIRRAVSPLGLLKG